MNGKRYLGFSLIELLVAVAIIVIIATIGITFYSQLRRSADLTKREADLKSIAAGLEAYRSIKGRYPVANSFACIDSSSSVWTNLEPFMKKLPKDPTGVCYEYLSDGVNYKVRTNINLPTADFSDTDIDSKKNLKDPAGDRAWAVYNSQKSLAWITGTSVAPTALPTAAATVAPTATPTATPSPTPVIPSSPGTCPTNGLVAYWRFDGNSNANVGGANFNLAQSGGVTLNNPGLVGQAAGGFMSSNDTLTCPDSVCGGSSGLEPANITVSLWTKRTNLPPGGAGEMILGKGVTCCVIDPVTGNPVSTLDYSYTMLPDDPISPIGAYGPLFHVKSQSGSSIVAPSGNNTVGNGWVMLTGTFDGISGKLYINGGFIDNNDFSAATTVKNSTAEFRVGAFSYWNAFRGLVDELGIWNRPLDPVEIANLYNFGGGTTCP